MDDQRDCNTAGDGVSRRAMLKGVATAGLTGTALTGTASAGGLNEITFRAAANETFSFQLIVNGRVKTEGGVGGVTADDDVQVAGSVVQGSLSDGDQRHFTFAGKISILQVDGRGTVVLNGEVIRDTTRDESGQKRLPKEVIVSSPNTDELLNYVFEVTGDLEKLEPNEDGGPARDEVSRRGDRVRVEGTVGTGDDRFAFSGEFISVEKPPEVQFDIQER